MKQKKEYYPNNNYGIYYFNASGKITKYKTNDNYWYKYKYNKNNDPIYYEDSYGYWQKWKYDDENNEICYENEDGYKEYKIYDGNKYKIVHKHKNYKETKIYTYNSYFKDSTLFSICFEYNDGWKEYTEYDEYGNDTYYEQSDGHYGYRETMYFKEKEIEYYYLLAKEDKIIEKRHLYEDLQHNLYQIRTGKKTFELKNNKYQKIKKGI